MTALKANFVTQIYYSYFSFKLVNLVKFGLQMDCIGDKYLKFFVWPKFFEKVSS